MREIWLRIEFTNGYAVAVILFVICGFLNSLLVVLKWFIK